MADEFNLDEVLESTLDDLEEVEEREKQSTTSEQTSDAASNSEANSTNIVNQVKQLMESLSRGDFEKTLEEISNPSFANFNEQMTEEEINEITKLMEEMASKPEMSSMMEGMLGNLISKELLYEPMKEMRDKYPAWLESNKSTLSSEEYNKYKEQYSYVQQMCEVYETDPQNVDKLVNLLQKMQDCGTPPMDIVKSLTPDLDFDSEGLPNIPGLSDVDQNCTIIYYWSLYQMYFEEEIRVLLDSFLQ